MYNLCFESDRFDNDKGQKSSISGRRLVSIGFFKFSPVGFCPFLQGFLCKLVRKPPQNVEKIALFPGGEIAKSPVTSLAVMVFSVRVLVIFRKRASPGGAALGHVRLVGGMA